MKTTNHKAQQVPKKDKVAFLRERSTKGNKFEGLSLLQENVISYLHSGFSMSYIARQIYHVHPNTLSNAVNSVKFVQILDEVSEAEQIVSYQLIVNKLAEIINQSTNEANIISACKALATMLPSISQKQLYDALVGANISIEEAQDLLNNLNLEDSEGVEGDEQEAK